MALVAAGIASWIGYHQWQTAKAKVVLDLFELRLEVYKLVSDAVMDILMKGPQNIRDDTTSGFARGLIKSKFLFGPDVYTYLEHIWRVINKLASNAKQQDAAYSTNKMEGLFQKEDKLMTDIISFHDKFDQMMFPYLRMDQKLPQSGRLRIKPRFTVAFRGRAKKDA